MTYIRYLDRERGRMRVVKTPFFLHGVQGVVGSNPITPTNKASKIKDLHQLGVGLFFGLMVFNL